MILFNITLLIWGMMIYTLKSHLNFKWRNYVIFVIPAVFACWCFYEPMRFSVPSTFSFELASVHLSPKEAKQTGFNWTSALQAIYITGVLFSLLAMLVQTKKILALKMRSTPLGNNCFEIHPSDKQSAFNFFGWIFIPTNSAVDLKTTMLIHEEAHRRKYHSAEKLLMGLLQALFWFNPGLYLLNNTLNVLQEAQADYLSLQKINQTKYVQALLSSAMGSTERLSFGLSFSQHTNLKTRIKMMYQKPKRRVALAAMSISCICLLVVSACENAQAGDEKSSRIETRQSEKPAEYPGGNEAMMKYIMNNLGYPKLEDGEEVEGKVFVKFTITETGDVENVTVLRGIHPVFDEAARKVVASFPKWSPATKDGSPVNSELTLPIMFQYD